MNYESENSLKHSISIPFKVDRQSPVVKGCKLEGNVLTLDVSDNSGMFYVSVTDAVTGECYEKFYDSYVEDDKIVCVFENNEALELSDIRLDFIDKVMNYGFCFLGGFDGKIGAQISEIYTDGEFYSMTFEFGGDDEFSNASLILAFYDENGRVMHMNVMENQTVTSGEYEFAGDFDVSTAYKCKLFIWEDFKTFKPLDTAKEFNMNMYEISSEK